MADSKNRYWVGVGYPESMKPDWQNEIADKVELPFAYCIHDKDKDGHDGDRKVHMHMILAFPNPTTYNHALSVFNELSADGKTAFNAIKRVISMRHQYDYLIHDTEDSRKKKKHLYDKSERIEGNNFDIGNYEQMSLEDKKKMRDELSVLVFEKQFTNYLDFYMYVASNFDEEYTDIIVGYSSHFDRLCKGCYHKWVNTTEKEKMDLMKEANSTIDGLDK